MPATRSRLLATLVGSVVAAASCVSVACMPVQGQETDRIWGRVATTSGDVHEGFLRWDRNEASWVDVLDGSKALAWEKTREWTRDPDLRVTSADRVIVYGGYRITWDDAEAEFPSTAESGIRFGHIRRIRVAGEQKAEVLLRSAAWTSPIEGPATPTDPARTPERPDDAEGVTVVLEGGSTDLGPELRELLVDAPGGEVVRLEWEDLDWVELGPPPDGVQPLASRIHGTVEARSGRRHTGAIAWGHDEALVGDTLEGRDERGRRREIPFSRIASLRPNGDGAEVTMDDGTSLRLTASDDLDDDTVVQISDPGLGHVELEWGDVSWVRLQAPGPDGLGGSSHRAFDGGRRLRGTVVTVGGDELTGWIRWDADEEYSWELLNGRDGRIGYEVELGRIASIEKASRRSARVTLLDGRVLELRGSNDVGEGNKGVLVRTAELEASGDPAAEKWIRVRWDDFEAVRFHR